MSIETSFRALQLNARDVEGKKRPQPDPAAEPPPFYEQAAELPPFSAGPAESHNNYAGHPMSQEELSATLESTPLDQQTVIDCLLENKQLFERFVEQKTSGFPKQKMFLQDGQPSMFDTVQNTPRLRQLFLKWSKQQTSGNAVTGNPPPCPKQFRPRIPVAGRMPPRPRGAQRELALNA